MNERILEDGFNYTIIASLFGANLGIVYTNKVLLQHDSIM